MSTGTEIVKTIIHQLGPQFRAMTGANEYMSRDGGTTLSFRFKGSRKVNKCLIHLNGLDLYDISFYQLSKKFHTCTLKKKVNDVYAVDLRNVFTAYTGLDTHL